MIRHNRRRQNKNLPRLWQRHTPKCESCRRKLDRGGRYCYYCGKRKGLW